MNDLKIIVCLRQVPDPEGCAANLEIDLEENKVTSAGIPPVINPFDENALEAALRLKEKHRGTITAICLGEKLSKSILIKALAVGADDLILLDDEGFKGVDSYSRAYILSRAVNKIGEYNLILTGMQTSDWGFSQVGILLAEILGIPSVGNAQSVELEGTDVIVKRSTTNGSQVVKASMPALITADSLMGELRYPSLHAIVLARKRSLCKWGMEELGIDPGDSGLCRLVYRLSLPPQRRRNCIMVEGETPEEKGKNLARIVYAEQVK
jgi:electron transfer flavoprotein beta subunit